MTAFALPVKGILDVQPAGLRHKAVTGLTFFYRLTLFPEITASLVVMMANLAGNAVFGVLPMAEPDRRFFRQTRFLNPQPGFLRRDKESVRPPGPQPPQQCQGRRPDSCSAHRLQGSK